MVATPYQEKCEHFCTDEIFGLLTKNKKFPEGFSGPLWTIVLVQNEIEYGNVTELDWLQ